MITVPMFDQLVRLQHDDRHYLMGVAEEDFGDVTQLVAAAGMTDRVQVQASRVVQPGRLVVGRLHGMG